MKKIIIFFLGVLSISSNVLASDITNQVDIKYKWYKQTKETGFYYPKKDKLPDYLEDELDFKYGEYSDWNILYCSYSKENYLIEEKEITTYDKLVKTKYVKLSINYGYNCPEMTCFNDIRVFSGKKSVNFNIIKKDPDLKILELYEPIDITDLWFYISTDVNYFIYATDDIRNIHNNLGYGVNGKASDKIIIPYKNWLLTNARYYSEQTDEIVNESPFIKNIVKTKTCRVREINTYRYKIRKEYYDNLYHSYIENYFPDINDHYVTYNDNYHQDDPPQITASEKEYVYVSAKNEEQNLSDNEYQCINQGKIIYKQKFLNKIPRYIYSIIILLIIITIIELIIIIKKKVD